jgi:hypothetical protein
MREVETVITEETAITVEQAGRGAWATITDEGHPLNGLESFGSTPDLALRLLLKKMAEVKVSAQ